MKPRLPREFLWTDLNTMEDFIRLDPVNEDFLETFVKLRDEPFGVKIDTVKVFNEAYYQTTRFIFEYPMSYEVPDYISDIKANLGWSYSAKLVLSMLYWLTEIMEEKIRSDFKVLLRDELIGCDYWKPFGECCVKLVRSGKRLKYDFKPRPGIPRFYINWSGVTCNYDLEAIEFTLNLWDDHELRQSAAGMIKYCMKIDRNNRRREPGDDEVIRLLDTVIGDDVSMPHAETPPNEDALQSRISELETENERLNTLLEEKKQSGKDRKFTLVQIVDYCKGCVDWNDVKSIVAMLNKLLRRIGTDEDSDLVDSIEAEFINRKYGDTVMGDKNEFNDNSGLNRITLPKGISAQEALRLLQNKKKEDGEEG